MKNGNALLIALGTGLAIGGLLGVLYAPNKGSETRERFRRRGQQLKEDLRERFQRAKDDAMEDTEHKREEYA
jgi:gas vesicle protein